MTLLVQCESSMFCMLHYVHYFNSTVPLIKNLHLISLLSPHYEKAGLLLTLVFSFISPHSNLIEYINHRTHTATTSRKVTLGTTLSVFFCRALLRHYFHDCKHFLNVVQYYDIDGFGPNVSILRFYILIESLSMVFPLAYRRERLETKKSCRF